MRGGNKRRKHQIIEKPIIIGTISFHNPKKSFEGQKWYKWSCYVRGEKGEDISYFVKKVQFILDSSFQDHHRVVEQYPFQIHQEGWGQFQIQIRVTFQDPSERPIDFTHSLLLDPPQGSKNKKFMQNQTYDVVVFCEPTQSFYSILLSKSLEKVRNKSKFANSGDNEDTKQIVSKHRYPEYFQSFDDSSQLQMLTDAIMFMKSQNLKLREEHQRLESQIITQRKQYKESRYYDGEGQQHLVDIGSINQFKKS